MMNVLLYIYYTPFVFRIPFHRVENVFDFILDKLNKPFSKAEMIKMKFNNKKATYIRRRTTTHLERFQAKTKIF